MTSYTRSLHECHGESALVRMLNAIDAVIVDNDKTTNDNWSPLRQTKELEKE